MLVTLVLETLIFVGGASIPTGPWNRVVSFGFPLASLWLPLP